MAKLNKKLLAATLGAAAAVVTVPVILTSCSQGTEQNSGNGQENNNNNNNNNNGQDSIKNDAIASTDGNSYNEAIVLDGVSSVETVKNYLYSNPTVIANIKTNLLNDKSRFNHVDISFKDVYKTADDSYSIVFESELNTGFRYTDGSTESKYVNVALTNVSFKDATVKSSYNYDGAINVYEINQVESLTALESYLTKDNNKVLNEIVDASLNIVTKDSTNIKSVQYVKDSIKQVNGKYQITLLAETKAKHLFADGTSQQAITLNLTNPEFSLLGAESSNRIYYRENIGQGAMAQLKTMTASKESAEKWMSADATLEWLNKEISSDAVFANTEITSYVENSVKMINDNSFIAQVVVTGKGKYVFENGVKTKVMNIEIQDARWQFVKANASNATKEIKNVSEFWIPNTKVYGKDPTQARAEEFVSSYKGLFDEAKGLAGLSNATLSNDYQVKLLENGDINVTYTATANAFTRFSNGSKEQKVTLTLTNIQWKTKAYAFDSYLNVNDTTWFNDKKPSLDTFAQWLNLPAVQAEIKSVLLQNDRIGNVKDISVFMTTDYTGNSNNIAVIYKAEANSRSEFSNGTKGQTFVITFTNVPWAK